MDSLTVPQDNMHVIVVKPLEKLTTKKRKKDIIILIVFFVVMVLVACFEPSYIGRISTLKMCIVFGIDMIMVAVACFMWQNAKTSVKICNQMIIVM